MEGLSIFLFSSNTIYLLVTCFVVTLIMLLSEIQQKVNAESDKMKSVKSLIFGQWWPVISAVDQNNNNNNMLVKTSRKAPGPKSFPIIGNLKELDGYEVPYQAFSALAKKFGSVVSLKLGYVDAVVVNGIDNIKEVLINKGQHFDSRPNFRRYQLLFSGNKENSLAFCDWSETQKARRDMLVPHTFPRNFSSRFDVLNNLVNEEIRLTIGESRGCGEMEIKPIIMNICANVFSQYFASHRFELDDPKFKKLVQNFDLIFYEVNQGYAADFLPFLLPLHRSNLKRMDQLTEEIREIMLDTIINDRYDTWVDGNPENDYVDSLITYVKKKIGPDMEWETALFALEDIIGGHSAVGNFLVKVFGYIIQHPEVQHKIQAEVDHVLESEGKQIIDLSDRNRMCYTEAVIMEALRLIASPIVPHVANRDSQIAGYDVPKDTLIFLNNYDLSMSDDLWETPETFIPERFLQNDRLVKPDFFIPFGAGRRSCMGYKMTQLISFSIIANLLRSYKIAPVANQSYFVPVGSLAMPEKSYKFQISPRH
ncbi:cytochrome P450 307a1-like [Toxorhynchites rutilus septentrionalis]|uniref:cytochrome P450 307a1-like n=1 Tax=Toxorhynchites rutilus septentrionalis TaxID=329112 RepID=UPI002478550D|nr:cytochrome P450 307a1-like [Toxorhynchites rutilus septentrionalis]